MAPKSLRILLCSSGAVVCLAIGFVGGRLSGGDAESSVVPGDEAKDSHSAAGSPGFGPDGASAPKTARIPGVDGELSKDDVIRLAREMNAIPGLGAEKLRQILSVHEALRRQDVEGLVRELMDTDGVEAQHGLFLAMGAYVEQAPGAALELALENASDQGVSGALYQAVQANMKIDPHRTFARLKGLENPQMRGQMINVALSALAATDPEQALQIYLANPSVMAGAEHSVSGMFHHWALNDPEGAAAGLAKIQNAETRSQAASSLVNGWARSDPEAAWAWAMRQPPSTETHRDPRVQLLTVWASTEPETALNKALTLESRELQNSVLPNIVQQWARKDVDAALSWVLDLEDSTLMANSMRQLAYTNSVEPDAFFDILVRDMPAGGTFESTVSAVISRWAREDPGAAASALESLPMGDAFRNAAGSLVREWSKKKPGEAFRWVMSLPEGAARETTLSNFFSSSVQSDSSQALQFFSALSPGEQQRYASNIASGLASRDLNEAIQFTSTITDANVRKNAYENIGRTWARNDPRGAGEWALRLGADDRSQVLSGVVRSWAGINIEAAAAWLASKPANPDLDEATAQLSYELVGVDPFAATEWADAITDDRKKRDTLYRVAQSWKRNDPRAARSWIQSSRDLTEKQKERLLK